MLHKVKIKYISWLNQDKKLFFELLKRFDRLSMIKRTINYIEVLFEIQNQDCLWNYNLRELILLDNIFKHKIKKIEKIIKDYENDDMLDLTNSEIKYLKKCKDKESEKRFVLRYFQGFINDMINDYKDLYRKKL